MEKIIVKWNIYVNKNGIKRPAFRSKSYTTAGYKVYSNTSYKLAKLDKTANLLYHFVCEEMDESNNIVHTHVLRKKFIEHARKNLSINVKDDTVKKAFNKLVKVELLINYDQNSDFTVNPRHVFKGPEKQREKLMNQLIHTMKKHPKTRSNFKSALGIN